MIYWPSIRFETVVIGKNPPFLSAHKPPSVFRHCQLLEADFRLFLAACWVNERVSSTSGFAIPTARRRLTAQIKSARG